MNFAKYDILDTIYESRNSLVYRARRRQDDLPVILKILNAEYPTPQQLGRYRQEFTLTSGFKSDGVIGVYGLEPSQRTLMMSVEDFGATSLHELLTSKEFSLADCLRIALRVTEIIGEIHAANVIHKDINPSNIVMNPDSGRIKLIDFGIATLLPRESPTITHPNMLEGTLAYLSPEQTGRMNRALDYRTDFYSLGVTLYELLTGGLPFTASDPLECIHAHIALQAEPPHALDPAIPEALSGLVMKLLAKNAEDRYQSAFGLAADLTECLRQVDASGRIVDFPLAAHDVSVRFHIPQTLYGRTHAIEQLLAGFERAGRGSSELMLVTGFSGIGKSSLIDEIHKALTSQKGLYAAGKFDQFARDIPYSAPAQAFQELCRYVLMEREEVLDTWKTLLMDALGPNARVLIDLVPQLELILGPQPPVQELGPTEAQNRFQLVVKDFVRVFARADHPLVLCIDDLQWADVPSLNLLTVLLSDPDLQYLFVIGAYRDNEVETGHPLLAALSAITDAGNAMRTVHVAPLDLPELTRLVADTTQCTPETATPLARLLHAKTGGNPFFAREFLLTLYRDGLMNFDTATGHWTWDLERIEGAGITDNVVELMTGNLRTLPPATQEIVKLAACLGNTFDLNSLSLICRVPAPDIVRDVQEALQQEILVPLGDEYKYFSGDAAETVNARFKFVHDRVQQAAYAMLDPEQRRRVHLSIGRVMQEHLSADEQEEHLIEMVRHLNEGRRFISDAPEAEHVARLNCKAAVKARKTIAYQVAFQYAAIGLELLADDSWDRHYDLTLTLSQEYAQAAYLAGDHTQAEDRIRLMLQRVNTPLEKAEILRMQALQYVVIGKLEEAIHVAIHALTLIGIKLPGRPGAVTILKKVLLGKLYLGRRKIADLVDLPMLTDVKKKLALNLLAEMAPAAYMIGNANLVALITLEITNLSLRYGNMPESAYGYVCYGLIAGAVFGDLKTGYEFGKLALALNERFQDVRLQGRILFGNGITVYHWNEHWSTLTPLFRKGMEASYQVGDLFYVAFNTNYAVRLDPTLTLEIKCEKMLNDLPVVKKTKQQDAFDAMTMYLQMFLNFRGKTSERCSMNDDSFDEVRCLEGMRARGYITGVTTYYLIKAEICWFYEEYAVALNHFQEAEQNIQSILGDPHTVRYCLLVFLTFAARYPDMRGKERAEARKRLKKERKQMKKWAAHCPGNFLHLRLIMDAELARLSGKAHRAADVYEQAITAAREHEWLQDEALANELAAKFYLHRGQTKIAGVYMQDARYLYARWGADRKVEFLEERYPQLLKTSDTASGMKASTIATATSGTASAGAELDLDTIMKASHSISGEIVLPELLKRMMRIMSENAGAQRGALLLRRGEQMQLVARASVEQEEVLLTEARPFEQCDDLPISLLQYAIRTQENLVLYDAAHEGDFTHDPYIARTQSKSLFCMPMLSQGTLTGLLFLENNLTVGAFSPDRIKVLNLLSSQAAISLENAGMYGQLEEKVAQRTAELASAKDAAEVANHAKSAFLANMTHELRSPLNAILGFTQIMTHGQGSDRENMENLNIITRSGEHLLSLINQVLDLSKIEAGHMTLDRRDFNLSYLLDDVGDMFRLKAEAGGVQLVLERAPDLPSLVRADEVKLRQVLINLLNNALKFTKRGGVTVRVSSMINEQLSIANCQLRVEVEDTGPGIAPEEIGTLFEAFEQTSSGRRSQEGTGLGLPISRKFVQLMGGDIQVQSRLGEGTTFRFEIEVDSLDEVRTQASEGKIRRVIALEPGQPRYRMLVVDDTPANRLLLLKLLQPLGFELQEAENGEEAVAVWKDWQPHLIWMDLRMPVMDGSEATKRIKSAEKTLSLSPLTGEEVVAAQQRIRGGLPGARNIFPDNPPPTPPRRGFSAPAPGVHTKKPPLDNRHSTIIIVITAGIMEEDQAVMRSTGCDDFLRKPFREQEMFDLLTTHLGVRFVYEEETLPDTASAENIDLPAAIAQVPPDLAEQLRHAVERSDMDRIERILDEIHAYQPAAADLLREWSANFDYEQILQVLQG